MEMFKVIERSPSSSESTTRLSEQQESDDSSNTVEVTNNRSNFVVFMSRLCGWRCSINHKRRFILVLLVVCCNFALLIHGVVLRSSDFDTFLISLFIMNAVLYTVIYGLMKLLCGERPKAHTWIFFTLMLLFALPSGYYYFSAVSNWYRTPAQSREINQDCAVFNFYDSHDLWHFLSSITIFWMFMLHLTFDDDLCATPRNRINVF